MRSDAATVDDFLAEYHDGVRAELERLRGMVRSEAPDARETMEYGGPVYRLASGPILCGFMAQKRNLAFYVGLVPDDLRAGLRAQGCDMGKTCVRFRRLDDGKLAALRTLLREVIARDITC
jgi:uncharacterized protein YdhG (YjbR/CyaY superfamily)